jgi:hypothetical protein
VKAGEGFLATGVMAFSSQLLWSVFLLNVILFACDRSKIGFNFGFERLKSLFSKPEEQ